MLKPSNVAMDIVSLAANSVQVSSWSSVTNRNRVTLRADAVIVIRVAMSSALTRLDDGSMTMLLLLAYRPGVQPQQPHTGPAGTTTMALSPSLYAANSSDSWYVAKGILGRVPMKGWGQEGCRHLTTPAGRRGNGGRQGLVVHEHNDYGSLHQRRGVNTKGEEAYRSHRRNLPPRSCTHRVAHQESRTL